jgi:hypothetical protein
MIIEAKLHQLCCLPTRGGVRVTDYVATWRIAYNQMEAARHLPSEQQLLTMFVNGLLTNSVSFITLYDNVLNSLNNDTELPNIQHLFDHTIYIENNQLQTCLLNPNSHPSSNSALTPIPLIPNKINATMPTQGTNTMLNCGNYGRRHPTDKCFQPGGAMEGKRDKVLANKLTQPQAHLAEIDEGVEPEEETKSDDDNVLMSKFATMSFGQSNDIILSTYVLSSIVTTLDDIPLAFASLSQRFNSVLDSACTSHIIHDRQLFHTYDPDGSVAVKTANCGFLEMLAMGDVKFRMILNGHTIIWTLKNCLHAPMAPVNLISVGALQEHHILVTFSYQKTIISFPMDHPDLTGLSFEATVHCHLSLLDLDFIMTPPINPESVSTVTTLACLVFPVASITTDLWHRWFGHLSQDATQYMLLQDFATGITLSAPSTNVPTKCIPCLIGKFAQTPY